MGKIRSLAYLPILLCLALCIVKSHQAKITLDNILAGTFRASGFSGTWVSDFELEYTSGLNLMKYNLATNTSEVSLNGTEFTTGSYPGRTLTLSSDKRYILITHSRKPLWRHSFFAKYHIYDTVDKVVLPLVPPVSDLPANEPHPDLQLVRWSPASGSALVFVYNNNIYYRSSSALLTSEPIKITSDGSPVISNGHTDWVYEEEMFGSGSALWFSPNGNHLAFIKFDDSTVPDFEYAMYGEPGNQQTVYPKYVHLRYPKSGQRNPIARMHFVDLTSTSLQRLQVLYPIGTPADPRHYVSKVSWRSPTELVIVHLNRRQQEATWFNCVTSPAANTPHCRAFWTESEPNGWIDSNSFRFSNDGSKILTLSSAKTTGADRSYRHFVIISGTEAVHVHPGDFHVDSVLGWNDTNSVIYFSGTGQSNPSEAQVYTVTYVNATPTINCITCLLQNGHGELCQANSASFSTEFTYFLHSCSGPGIPESAFRPTATPATYTHVWTDNEALRVALKDVETPGSEEFFAIPLAGGFQGRARLYLPPDFDRKKKYPLMIDVYGGPDSQNVRYGFGFNWGSSLTSDKNVIYGYIDGRGSGRQTKEHLFQLNNRLGTVEIEDQITATKWLIDNTNYIDPNRTAIWGWSYGGYATAMVMSTDTTGVFKCGISVAPVTSWLYYDTIYTERYMGLPTVGDNQGNYNSSEVTTHVENFRNKQFFLVHGNADDNVHYQQSMILSRALEQADIMFYQLSYPDEAHSINGRGMNRHLYHSLEKFLFRDCFPEVQENPESSPNPGENSSTDPGDNTSPDVGLTSSPNPEDTTSVNPPSSAPKLLTSTFWLTGITTAILLALPSLNRNLLYNY